LSTIITINTTIRSKTQQLLQGKAVIAITKEEYIWSILHINRFLRKVLTPSEFMLLLFDVDRTFRFSKSKENIPYSVYKSGIASNEGTAIIGPIGLSDRSVRNARKGLVKKGIEYVIIGSGRGYSEVSIIFVKLKKLIVKEMKKMLKIPKKQRKLRGVNFTTLGGNIAVGNKGTEVKGTESLKTINKAKTSLRTNSISVGEKAKQKHREKHKEIIEKIVVPTIKNVSIIWADAISSYKANHKDAIVINPTKKELILFVHRTKQIFKDSSWKEVLYEAVSHWDLLVPHFTWVSSSSFGGGAPSVPSLQFVRSFYPQVIESQQEQLKINACNQATQKKRNKNITINKKIMGSMTSKIKELESKLQKEKIKVKNIETKNNTLSSKLSKIKETKKKYYNSLPQLSDSELMSMDLPEHRDFLQNRVN